MVEQERHNYPTKWSTSESLVTYSLIITLKIVVTFSKEHWRC